MTLQSRSDSVDYGDDPGEASSSSKEVISFPLGTQSQVAISQEHQQLVNITNNSSIVDNVTLNNATATFGHNFGVTVHGNAILHVNGATGLEQHLPIQNGLSHNDAAHSEEIPLTPQKKLSLKHKQIYFLVGVIAVLALIGLILVVILIQTHGATETTTAIPSTTPDYGFFIPREVWSKVDPKAPPILIPPALLVVVKHTGGSICLDHEACIARVREIQAYHMDVLMYPDISYNFLIGGDQKIYVGRGWGVRNEGRNDSVDIAFIVPAIVHHPPKKKPPKSGLELIRRHYKGIVVAITSITLICTVTLVALKFLPSSNQEVTTTTPTTTSEDPTITTTRPSLIHYVFNRSSWGARSPSTAIPLDTPVKLMIIKHTNTKGCSDLSSCFTAMQDLQYSDVGEHGLSDIRYNFVIGGDGNIYEGRGWQVQNAQMNGTIDVAFLGNYNVDEPSPFMVAAGPWLIVKGLANGYLSFGDFRVVCHNQTEDTDSPGQHLYKEVVKWKYYSDEIIRSQF